MTGRGLRVSGELQVPGDKSISHRSLICSALAEGTSRVRGVLPSADVHSTAGVLRALGVEVPALAPSMVITGAGRRSLRAPHSDLDCGNSGTTSRLMAGVVAGSGLTARFTGDASLSRRPMRRVKRPLEMMGATVELPQHGGLPMTVRGAPLTTVEWRSDTPSAQVKSCILLAALCAGVEATVREPSRSRDHTERMLASQGAEVWVNEDAVLLFAGQRLAPLDLTVPGDPSSAAFFAALAALAPAGELRALGVGVNETRTGFFAALREMGASIELEDARREGGDPVAELRITAGAASDRRRGAPRQGERSHRGGGAEPSHPRRRRRRAAGRLRRAWHAATSARHGDDVRRPSAGDGVRGPGHAAGERDRDRRPRMRRGVVPGILERPRPRDRAMSGDRNVVITIDGPAASG
ncbi:MAG: 3-phosphoshikimate 1-carboxyvinyltransferase, partial [Gemmatimonadaceae bacterium]|nr:3-phosphoshikimate 1-carboxyvinyltransferase [Gemmatimonadaceae bacterium]